MPTCLLIADKGKIDTINNMDDVYNHVEKQEQILIGGENLEEIIALSESVLGKKLYPEKSKTMIDGTTFYLFNSQLRQKIGALKHEELLQLSVDWSEADYWKNRIHNRMDLAGFLLDISSLCMQAADENKELYVVVES